MRKLIIFILTFSAIIVHAQSDYDVQMQRAMITVENGNFTQAITQLEKLVTTDNTNWIPKYYLALTELKQAFRTNNSEEKIRLFSKAREVVEAQLTKEENAEWLLLLAFSYTAELTTDPINKGVYLTEVILNLYDRALKLDPGNPRVALEKMAFQMEVARFYSQDLKPFCVQLREIKLKLENSNTTERAYYPNWEKKRFAELLKTCDNE